MIAPNTIVGGRYRVVKPLGGGGMKLVYLAEDLRLAARRCALAEVVDNFTSPDAQRQAIDAFQREADMLARLNNEHIPRVFDRFSEQNRHYLVMEFIDGATLEEEMKKSGGRLDEPRVIDIALQVLATLEYLHGLEPPVIYRDLKPSNVMMMANGQAKLIDFGIARHFQPLQNVTMIGTQGYAPPEQYRGKVEQRSDLYALGATMHHALSGRDPANEPPFSFPPLATLCPGLKPALAGLVDEALAYDVERRVPSAADFRHRLENIRDGVAGEDAGAAIAHANGGAHAPATPSPHPAAPRQAAPRARSQLRLPLGSPGQRRAVSHSAPTLLRADSEIECARCARSIPVDSRFCSFCGAEIPLTPPPGDVQTNHEAATVLLSVPPQEGEQPRPFSRAYRPAHGVRRPILVLLLIFVGTFAAVKTVAYLLQAGSAGYPGASAPDSRRADAPPPAAPDASAPGAEPDSPAPDSAPGIAPLRAARLDAFRAALDAGGLTGVHFRMIGDTMELTGTVPTATDEAMVQMLALNVAGVVSLRDYLRVQSTP